MGHGTSCIMAFITSVRTFPPAAGWHPQLVFLISFPLLYWPWPVHTWLPTASRIHPAYPRWISSSFRLCVVCTYLPWSGNRYGVSRWKESLIRRVNDFAGTCFMKEKDTARQSSVQPCRASLDSGCCQFHRRIASWLRIAQRISSLIIVW